MGVQASGATLEIQLVADVARLKSDMAQMQAVVNSATGNVGNAFGKMASGTGVAASAMAASAQQSARAAMGMGAAYGEATGHIAGNTIAMRESIVLMREFARGNYSRMAGSFSILAQSMATTGTNARGLFMMLLQMAGVLKVTQNAELAEAAAQKAGLAAAIQRRAESAAGLVVARQAQVAIAQSELAAAVGSDAEAAAQARLVKALRSVEVASGKATIAQDALTGAQAESTAANAAAASGARTVIGGTGVGLIGIGIVAGVAYGAIKQFQDQVKDSGQLDAYADKLNLTDEQIKKLGGSVTYLGHNIKEVQGLTVTFGDVMHAVWQEVGREASAGDAWGQMKERASGAFDFILEAWMKASASLSAGLWTLGDIAKDVFQYIAQKIGQSFYDGVNKAIDGINSLSDKIPTWAGGGKQAYIPHLSAGPPIPDLGSLNSLIQAQSDRNYAYALEQNRASIARIQTGAISHREATMKQLSDANNPRAPKKQSDHGLAESLAELRAAIKGQLDLANAYLVSDAAAIKATALQKAEEDAIKHKSQTGVFYELELQKAVATGAAEGAKKVAQLRDENAARAAVNDNVASGALSYRKMNDALKDQEALQPLLVLQTLAHGQALVEITAIIEAYRKALAAAHAEEDRSKALEQLGKLNEQHAQTMALLDRESGLTGIVKDKRDEILKLLQQELELRAEFPGMTQEEIRQVVAQTAAEDNLRRHLDQVEAGMDQLRQTGEQMLDTVFNVDNWTDPFKMLLDLLKQVEQEFVTIAFANPLKNSMFGENMPTLGSVGGIGGFFSSLLGMGGTAAPLLSGVPSFSSAMASAAIPTVDIGAFPGLASGGWTPIGGNGGIDQNILSLNWRPIARVSADEHLAVIPRGHGAANQNSRSGDTHIHVHVADTGDPIRNRQTGTQAGAGAAAALAQRNRKGTM